jgi:hypothetical protein
MSIYYQNFLHCKFATDSTLPQQDMDSICAWYAANLILTKLKSSTLQGNLIQLILFTSCVINNPYPLRKISLSSFSYYILFSITQNVGTRMGVERDFFAHQRAVKLGK